MTAVDDTHGNARSRVAMTTTNTSTDNIAQQNQTAGQSLIPSLLTPHSSLLTPHSSLLTPHSSPLTPHSTLSASPHYQIAYLFRSSFMHGGLTSHDNISR